jgi:hypothetical protein
MALAGTFAEITIQYDKGGGGWEVWLLSTVPDSLDRKGGRRLHLLLSKSWHFLLPFLSNEPGTVLFFIKFYIGRQQAPVHCRDPKLMFTI